MPSKDSKRYLWVKIFGTIISLLLLTYLLSQQNWEKMYQQIRMVKPLVWLICFGLYFTGQVFNAFRWFSLLRAKNVDISFKTTLKIVLSGGFASNFMPSTVGGDIIRVLGSQAYTKSYSLSVASVALDRSLNVLTMITVLPFSFVTFNLAGIKLDLQQQISFSASFQFVNLRKKIFELMNKFKQAIQLWASSPRSLIKAFIISWLSVLVIFIANTILANHLNIHVKLYQVMGVNAITYLLTLLPITFNGYGVREVLITTIYMTLGGTLEQATTLALVTRFFMLIETLPGSIWLGNFIYPRKLSTQIDPETEQ